MEELNTVKAKPKSYYSSKRDNMLQFLPKHIEKSLEFGCSSGLFSERIKQQYDAEVWGVDLDEWSIEAANKRLDKAICGDVTKLVKELPKYYFDCIICNDILEHLTDPYSFLNEIKELFSDGGTLVVSLPNVRSWGTFVEYFYRKDWEYKKSGVLDFTHFRFFTKKSMRRMFHQAGYEIKSCEGINTTKSNVFKIFNALTFGWQKDMKYTQFAFALQPLRNGTNE